MPKRWTAETIPPELIEIHSCPGGTSWHGLAEILNRYDELRDEQACALAEEALAADGYDDEEQRETVAALWPLQMEAIAAREEHSRRDMGRCPKCETTIIRFDRPIEVKVDETELCGAFKPGTYGAGMEVPVCLLAKGHGPDEMHWGVVEYETRWTDGGLEWIGKA